MNAWSSLFGRAWLRGLIAVVLAALLIWFAGPYLAFADYKPFESVTGRLVGLLVLVVIWALVVQISLLRAAQRGQAFAGAVTGQPDAAVVQQADGPRAAPSADATALRERFQTAVAALRKSKRGQNLYELPWYMIIGPPGSGKTTALQNSGLQFPLEKEFGRDPLQGVGGTRNCDWWITEQAILLDTAGRYTTQDSNEIADRAGWQAFLGQLKRYRKRRPVNGVLVAISVADLLHSSEAQRDQHAIAIRRRLDELRAGLGISFPVYVLVTKADLLAGFTEYFDDLNQAGRAQVWGATFPLAASQSGQALAALPGEFDLLTARLQERLVERLAEERDLTRRAAIQAFPAQLAGLKPVVCRFLGEVLRGSTQSDGIWIRGCYLTSGTQEGTPVDRLLAAMARTLGLGLRASPPRAGKGRAYFLEDLLGEVIFQEAGIAGVNRSLELRRAGARVLAYGSLAGITVLGVIAMLWSYRANRSYLEDVARLSSQALPAANGRSIDDAGIEPALPRLDGLRVVSEAADRYRKDGAPWSMRWGLFQGNDLGLAARDAYRHELNAELGPWVAQRFAGRLRELATAPDALYEYLKAYLMLGNTARLDPAQLKVIGSAEWRRRAAGDGDASAADRVNGHFEAWLDEPARMQPVPLDADLIEQTRVALQQASLPLLMYSRLRLAYETESNGRVNLARELSVGTDSLFVRRSGRDLAEPLSALYTRDAFESFARTGRLQLMKQFLEESWVLGDRAPNLSQSPRLASDVLALYEKDYIRAWDGLVQDLAVRPVRGLEDAKMMLGLLASPSSPLKSLLALVAKHTNFAASSVVPGAPPAAATTAAAALPGAVGNAAAKLASASSQLDQILASGAGAGASKPGARITEHFQALHRLVEGPAGGTPIDQTLASLAQLQQQISGAAPGAAGAAAVAQVMAQLQLVAAQLPAPVSSVVTAVGASSGSLAMGEARTDLGNRYQSQVVAECRELIGNRYPFNPASALDVTVADFARIFGPGGTFDTFFTGQLAPLVDTSRATWRWKEETKAIAALPLKPFQDAERIRQAFFRPGDPNPELQVTVMPEYLDADVNRFTLTIDGQTLEYSHGPQRPLALVWPSATPSGATVAFEDKAGGRPNRAFTGTWGLFRLFDAADVRRDSETRFVLGLSAGGRDARVVLTAGSIRNPFAQPALLRFRCGG